MGVAVVGTVGTEAVCAHCGQRVGTWLDWGFRPHGRTRRIEILPSSKLVSITLLCPNQDCKRPNTLTPPVAES